MAARVCSSANSSVHCQTFPTMSMTPHGLTPFACAFTGSGPRIFRDLSGTGTASGSQLPRGKADRPRPGLHIATPTHAADTFPPNSHKTAHLRGKPTSPACFPTPPERLPVPKKVQIVFRMVVRGVHESLELDIRDWVLVDIEGR